MSNGWISLPLVLGVGLSLGAQAPSLEQVRQSELAFARQADQQGIRPAFLAWLIPEAAVFTPGLTRADAHYGREPGDGGHLAWFPEAMDLSAAGDLAWSFGPWTYASKKGESVRAQGHFLSVWRRQGDGLWKVVADIGVPHPAPERPATPFSLRRPPAAPPKAKGTAQDLRQEEARLSAAWGTQGGSALRAVLSKEARVLRPGKPPLQDPEGVRRALEAEPPGSVWEPARLQVASSGDLAWTCGETSKDGDGTAASFLRIWIRESGAWKVLFDVRLPHRPPAR